MNGGTIAHYMIAANLLLLLRPVLDRDRFRLVPSSVKVIADGHVRYPDLIIARTSDDMAADIVADPVVVVEVVSPSSRMVDTVAKNLEYRRTPSIQQYVILEQDAAAATVWLRRGDEWVGALVTGEMTLDFPELGVGFPLADVYEGVSRPA